jgi:hypothetical protein
MISVAIIVRAKDGTEKPTPKIHIRAEEWSADVVSELFAVLCERAGAIGGVGLLSGLIRPLGERGVQLVVATAEYAAIIESVAIPAAVLEASGFPVGVSFRLPVRPYRFSAIDVLDLHLPVFAGRRVADDRLEPASPYIYGTAFPVWHGGLFATAAHVVKSAVAAGEVVLGRLGGPGPGIPGYGVERAEIFEEYDLALLKCPGLEKFPPVTVEMQNQLAIFDEVCAIGYPFSVDPEHLIAIHRGFAGHIVASRQLYRLRGQPFGYELSFPTPPGMSGAPLIHRGEDDVPRCYGYIVEQADTEFAGVRVSLGIAVSTAVFRTIRTQFLRDNTFSDWFGVLGAPPPPRHEPRRPSGTSQAPRSQVDDWPDEASEPPPKDK